MEAFPATFTDGVVLVLSLEEAAQLRRMLLVEFFAEECIGKEITAALDRELLAAKS